MEKNAAIELESLKDLENIEAEAEKWEIKLVLIGGGGGGGDSGETVRFSFLWRKESVHTSTSLIIRVYVRAINPVSFGMSSYIIYNYDLSYTR